MFNTFHIDERVTKNITHHPSRKMFSCFGFHRASKACVCCRLSQNLILCTEMFYFIMLYHTARGIHTSQYGSNGDPNFRSSRQLTMPLFYKHVRPPFMQTHTTYLMAHSSYVTDQICYSSFVSNKTKVSTSCQIFEIICQD